MISSASASNGFCTKWKAPTFIAETAVGTSPYPVIIMTAVLLAASAIRLSSSMPLRPGSWLSRMTQAGSPSGTDARYSSAVDMDGDVYQRINVTSVRNVALGDRWDGDVKIFGNTILVTTMRDGPVDTSGASKTTRIKATRP